MNTRDTILATVRRALGVTGRERTRRMEVDERIDHAPKGIVPARGQGDAVQRLSMFRTMAENAQATVAEVASPDDVPMAVATFLRDHNLPPSVRRGTDERLAQLPWDRTTLEVATGRSDGGDLSAVSHALAAVAETGTLVMTSGPDNPSTLNFLPDNHIVIVDAKDIGADYETTWTKIRMAHGKGEMPRTVNWITGPSRSADIEQTLLLGAHGPRRLHVVIVGG